MELLKEIHKGDNTIIMVTHNPDLTAHASRVVYMRDGRVHQDVELKENEKANIAKLHNAPSIDEEQLIEKRQSKRQPIKKRLKKAAN